MRNNLT